LYPREFLPGGGVKITRGKIHRGLKIACYTGALFTLLPFGGLMVATVPLFLLSFLVSFFFDSFIFEDTDDKYS